MEEKKGRRQRRRRKDEEEMTAGCVAETDYRADGRSEWNSERVKGFSPVCNEQTCSCITHLIQSLASSSPPDLTLFHILTCDILL